MKPSIFNFMDVQSYLKEYYKFQKLSDKHFSYSIWSQVLGLKNKTLLKMIVTGKRKITLKTIEYFKNNLNFSSEEKDYFETLVHYSQAKSQTQKQTLGSRLIQLHRLTFQQAVIPADSQILNDVFGPLVLMVISSSEAAISLKEISNLLELDEKRVVLILRDLLEGQMIDCKNDLYIALQNTFKVPDHFKNQSLRRFYEYWIEKSVKAIDLPSDIRRFQSLQVVLTQEEFEETASKVNEFSRELLSRFEHNTITNRKVYLVNTVLFPIQGNG